MRNLDRDGPARPQRGPRPRPAGRGRDDPQQPCRPPRWPDRSGQLLRRGRRGLRAAARACETARRRARSLRDQPAAPDVHLLQAPDRRAGPRARRAQSPRLQELDTDTPLACAATRRWLARDRQRNRRAHRPGAGGSGRDRRGHLGPARRDRQARGRAAGSADPCRLAPRPGRLAGPELQDERERAYRHVSGG